MTNFILFYLLCHHYSIIGTVIVYIVVVYNVELDEIFVISNVTVTIVPIIPYGNIIRGRYGYGEKMAL
jgi:hypothetical protein